MAKVVVSPEFMKAHVKGFTRKDGSFVKEHDDKRAAARPDQPASKAGGTGPDGGAYSHPHVVGKAEITDAYANEGAKDASGIKFAGTQYLSTGKEGKSAHDGTPVREFEASDSHRVWLDHHGRVHADGQSEVPALRKKFEAHEAQFGNPPKGSGEMDDADHVKAKGDPAAPADKPKAKAGDSVTDWKAKNGAEQKATAAAKAATNPGDGEVGSDEFGKYGVYHKPGSRVRDPSGAEHTVLSHNGPEVMTEKGKRFHPTKLTPVAGDAPAASPAAPAEAKAEPKATWASLKKHKMHSESDLSYFKDKGWTPAQIKEVWDRDAKAGHGPVTHQKDIPDTAGVAGNPDLYKALDNKTALVFTRAPGVVRGLIRALTKG